MDLFPRSWELEAVSRESFLAEDFKGSISLFSQFLARSRRGDVRSLQPNFVSFVIEHLHCLGCFGQRGLCFDMSFCEVVSKVLGHLAFDLMMGFESLVWVSSMVEEEQ